jgi:hypothetical protein
MVCAGELDAREAQRLIAQDWTAAYGRFFRQRGVGASNPSLTNSKQHPT